MHPVMRPAIVTAVLAAALILPSAACAQSDASRATEPHLVFKKSVVVKNLDKGQAHAEQHRIQKGDHLWKILREHYNMSDTSISFYCRIAREVNPDIDDLNVLSPDQNILLPFKFIPADGSDNRTVMIETADYRHRVQRGEHLGQILRSRFSLPDTVIFNRITKSLIHEANPHIADLNVIEAGQSITVPREVFAMSQIISHGAMQEPPLSPAEPEMPLGPAEPVMHTAAASPAEPETAAAPVQPDEMTFDAEPLSAEEIEIKNMLSRMTRQLEGTDNATGVEVFNPDGSATMRLDYSRFPAYNFPWGKKVVLDYGGRLPDDMRAVISSQWDNAEIVSVQARDDMEDIIGRVLDVCGFYKVEKDADYTVNRDAVQISVTGNWIVFKDSSLRNVFVVNLARDGKPSINPGLRSYLSGIGLEIMDIGAAPETSSDASAGPGGARPAAAYTEVAAAPAALTDTILRMLGIDFKTGFNTNIFQNMYSGFSLEVVADRKFTIDNKIHLIDFNSLPERITDIITRQGFKLLQIVPGEEKPDAVAGRVLEFCGADFLPPPATLGFDGSTPQNVRLTVPGYVVQTAQGRMLLTGSEINESISGFLREMDIAIVKY